MKTTKQAKIEVFGIIVVLLISLVFALGADKRQVNLGTFAAIKATVAAHSVTLSCTVPAGNVNGYNFYRGTVTGEENYTTPLNGSTVVTACSYADTNVVPNEMYFYTVKASCPTCSPVLSAASNEVTATVPADAQVNPPGGLTATAQ